MRRMERKSINTIGAGIAGEWVEPGGGLPPGAMSGRNVIQIICKRDKKTFITTVNMETLS
jgi:hypothetical protein